jgi:hypothetical protein
MSRTQRVAQSVAIGTVLAGIGAGAAAAAYAVILTLGFALSAVAGVL